MPGLSIAENLIWPLSSLKFDNSELKSAGTEPHRKGATLDILVLGWRVLHAQDARVKPRAQCGFHDPCIASMLVNPARSSKWLGAVATACRNPVRS